jgi:hypothetical protein
LHPNFVTTREYGLTEPANIGHNNGDRAEFIVSRGRA